MTPRQKTPLTAVAVAAAAPKGKRYETPDAGCPGLHLVVQPSGAKSWFVRYRINGERRKFTLGTVDAIPLKKARELAAGVIRDAAAGTDRQAEKITARRTAKVRVKAEETFRFVYESHYRPEHIRKTMKPSTQAMVEDVFDRLILPIVGRLPFLEVTPHDVKALSRPLSKAGKLNTANRVFVWTRAIYRWAANELLTGYDPTHGLKKPHKDNERDRAFEPAEIVLFWRACDHIGGPMGALYKLALLTAARREELRIMRWAEIDGAVWNLKGTRTKNEEMHKVHLPDLAQSVIASIPRHKGCPWVFTTDGEIPVANFAYPKERLDAFMAKNSAEPIDHWVTHDLRRTAATVMQSLGVPEPVTERILNHVHGGKKGVAKIYQRWRYLPETILAYDQFNAHIAELVKPR